MIKVKAENRIFYIRDKGRHSTYNVLDCNIKCNTIQHLRDSNSRVVQNNFSVSSLQITVHMYDNEEWQSWISMFCGIVMGKIIKSWL
jgi:hypothetical protein